MEKIRGVSESMKQKIRGVRRKMKGEDRGLNEGERERRKAGETDNGCHMKRTGGRKTMNLVQRGEIVGRREEETRETKRK